MLSTVVHAYDANALFEKAFGKKKQLPSQVSLELRINKAGYGEITAFTDQQHEISFLDTSRSLEILEEVLKEKIFLDLKSSLEAEQKTSFATLGRFNIDALYNSANLSIDLSINPDLRKPRVLSLQSGRRTFIGMENRLQPSNISAVLNLYSNLGIAADDPRDSTLLLELDGSVNIRDLVYEGKVIRNGAQWETDRQTLTLDKPGKLRRYVAGDIYTGSRGFQENFALSGLRISKEFFMDPEFQIRPQASESFVLETDSEVEVYINGLLEQRFYLGAGDYTLGDIGLHDGLNNIRLRIKDAFGKITEKTSSQAFDSDLLKPGLSLFAVSLGRRTDATESGKSADELLLSGYYQKGITDTLTLGSDVQISPSRFLVGGESIWSTRVGAFASNIAVSGGEEATSGYAGKIEFRPNLPWNMLDDEVVEDREFEAGLDHFIEGLNLAGEFRSKSFIGLDDILLDNNESSRLKTGFRANVGFKLNDNWLGTINAGYTGYYEDESVVTAGINISRRFANSVLLQFGARRDDSEDIVFHAQLSIPLDRIGGQKNSSLRLLFDSKQDEIGTFYDIRPRRYTGKGSLNGSLGYNANDSLQQAKLDLHYRARSYEASVNTNLLSLPGNGSSSRRLNLGLNSGLLCAGSTCTVSYPVENSFALATGSQNQQQPVAVMNGYGQFNYADDSTSSLPENYTALILDKDKLAVIPLDAYKFQRLNVDVAALPIGYDVEKTEFEVYPHHRSGYVFKAGGEFGAVVDGILLDEQGNTLEFASGQWVSENGAGRTIAFFTNKAGKFRLSSAPPGKYKLELYSSSSIRDLTINIPESRGRIYDLGKLRVFKAPHK